MAASGKPLEDGVSEQDGGERTPDGGHGVFVSYLVVVGIVVLTRVAARMIDSPSWRRRLYIIVIAACLTNAWLRRSVLVVTAFVLALSISVTTCNHGLPAANGPALRQFAGRVIDTATSRGQGKSIRAIVEDKRRARISQHIERAQAILNGEDGATGYPESPYLEAIRGRDPALRARAAELTAACDDGDNLCESARLLRFVADEIRYRNDPRGETDYIQMPEETLRIGAGDCEDQTILLISLLENIGIRTLMAFTHDHAYPIVCYERSLRAQLEEIARRRRGDRDYLTAVLPPELDLRRLSPREYRVGEHYCYALEPTAKGSWIGHPQEMSKVEAIFDPIERTPVRFGRPRVP